MIAEGFQVDIQPETLTTEEQLIQAGEPYFVQEPEDALGYAPIEF